MEICPKADAADADVELSSSSQAHQAGGALNGVAHARGENVASSVTGVSAIDEAIRKVNITIEKIDDEIRKINGSVEAINKAVDDWEVNWSQSESLRSRFSNDLDRYLQYVNEDLKEEEIQLREEESQLREEESQLREEEKQLRDKKSQLREEKKQLQKKQAGDAGFETAEDVQMFGGLRNTRIAGSMGKIELPDEKTIWPCGLLGTSPLFVRPCYVDLYDEILKRSSQREKSREAGLVLLGNPGIGKSCFLNYALIRLLKDKKQVLLELEGEGKALFFKNNQCFTIPRGNRAAYSSKIGANPDIYYLFDPIIGGNGPIAHKPFLVLAASPRRADWKNAEKNIQPIRKPLPSSCSDAGQSSYGSSGFYPNILHVPYFEKKELLVYMKAMCGSTTTEADVLEKFYFKGGVPRDFHEDASFLKTNVDTAVNSIKDLSQIRILLSHICNGSGLDNDEFLSQTVFRIIVYCKSGSYKFEEMTIGYISEYAKKKVEQRLSECSEAELVSLYEWLPVLHDLAGSFRGNLFATICHRFVPRMLKKGVVEDNRDEIRHPLKPNTEWSTEDLPAIEDLSTTQIRENVYYRYCRNNPTIDALFKMGGMYYAFQCTVRNKHDFYAGQVAKILLKLKLRNPECFRFVWVHVAPCENYSIGDFKDYVADEMKDIMTLVRMYSCKIHVQKKMGEGPIHLKSMQNWYPRKALQ